MDNVSVGDFAAHILAQDRDAGNIDTTTTTLHSTPSFQSSNILEQAPDISQVVVPNDFVNMVCEEEEEESSSIVLEEVLPRETTSGEENPVAEKAIDIMLEGLTNMLETVKENLREVKQFVNENSLTNELTAAGSIGVNMAPPAKKKKEHENEDDRMKRILTQMRGKKKVQK